MLASMSVQFSDLLGNTGWSRQGSEVWLDKSSVELMSSLELLGSRRRAAKCWNRALRAVT